MVTSNQFRDDFPEFTDSTAYPDTQVAFWLNIAYLRLRSIVWNDMLDIGAELFTAHNLVLEAQAAKSAASISGVPGLNSGPLTAKAVDKVSASYDAGVASIEGGGNYNITTYGTRFLELVGIVGIGGMQIC